MGKYILYAGILCAVLRCGAEAAEGHLFSFRAERDIRAEIREMQTVEHEEAIYRKLGEKKYLVQKGNRVIMIDMECCAEERIISWELVKRIEQEATENLQKQRKNALL